jgi:glycosyltransferase involved in cell wall biosynthesis
MKCRILAVTEFTELNTGYAVYFKELLSRLFQNTDLEIAEFACYVSPDDPKLATVPWKVYANAPVKGNQQEQEHFSAHPLNPFGAWKFDAVCCDFKPHIVISIRDFWMDAYIDASPFRRLFKWVWMPTVDSAPQHEQWIEMYSKVDAILTYNDWSGEILNHQSNGRINWIGSAPPIANIAYTPLDKDEIKNSLGFDTKTKVIGTVMRNQRRKLFPDLFNSFRQYLDISGDNDTYLYCHTSYPDGAGWEIPWYIKHYNICNKTLFTYVCDPDPKRGGGCGYVFPSFFNDAVTFCNRCGKPAAVMSNVHAGASPEVMANIYNLFDIYIQYANSEGFGVPLVEAAACAVPIMAIDFSAMSDVLKKLEGIPLKPLTLMAEIETGCMRAVPDNKDTANKLNEFFKLSIEDRRKIGVNTYRLYKDTYKIETTIGKWCEAFDNIQPQDLWSSPPFIHQPAEQMPENMNNKELTRWMIVNVLGDPSKLDSYFELRVTKDLNFGMATGFMHKMYFNENSLLSNDNKIEEFNAGTAFNYMRELCEKRNFWEKQRCGIK